VVVRTLFVINVEEDVTFSRVTSTDYFEEDESKAGI
jgi:hypothetical protein